nr:copper resistance protein CopC [Streptomyces reniochalinae]
MVALLTGGLALLGILATAGPAAAHAALTGSNPADGSVVRDAPRQVTLDFSEGVAMSEDSIRVLDPHGKRADTGAIRDTGTGGKTQRAVSLRSSLAKGTYTVAWQAVSADSHPVSGAFTFSVKEPSETSATVPQQDENAGGGAVGTLYGIGRYAAYAGFVLLVGGAGFVMLCAPRAASSRAVQRLTVTGWVTLTAATLALLLLRTPYTGSGRLADVLDLGGLKEVVATKPGAALVSRMLLLAAAALFVSVLFGAYARRRQDSAAETNGAAGTDGAADTDGPVGAREGHDLLYGLAIGGAVVAAGLAATWAMAEHASTGIQTSLAMPVDILHLLAVALWLGGLAALFCLLRWGPSPSGATVRRFSAVALTSVTVLAATGLYQSWRQVGTFGALTSTAYGQLLLVKVALVAVLVGIGWFSRRWTARLSEVPTEAENHRTGSVPTDVTDRTASLPRRRSPQPPVRASAPSSPLSSDSASAEDPSDGGPADPVRAAQLARQRDAADAARQRKRREADPERSGLRRSVLTEAAIAVVLLAVTTVLTNTEPGRTEAQAQAAGDTGKSASAGPVEAKVPFDTGGPGGKGTAALELDPGSRGRNTLHLHTTTPGGRPLDAPEVKVTFTLPAKDLGPLPVTLKPVAGKKGHWKAADVRLPMAGKWKLAVTVRTSDIDQVTTYKTATIG